TLAVVVDGGGADRDPAAGRQRGQFVLQKQVEEAVKLGFVDLERRQARRDLVLDLDFFRGERRLEVFDADRHHVVELHVVRKLELRLLRGRPEVFEQV